MNLLEEWQDIYSPKKKQRNPLKVIMYFSCDGKDVKVNGSDNDYLNAVYCLNTQTYSKVFLKDIEVNKSLGQ